MRIRGSRMGAPKPLPRPTRFQQISSFMHITSPHLFSLIKRTVPSYGGPPPAKYIAGFCARILYWCMVLIACLTSRFGPPRNILRSPSSEAAHRSRHLCYGILQKVAYNQSRCFGANAITITTWHLLSACSTWILDSKMFALDKAVHTNDGLKVFGKLKTVARY